MEEPKDRIWNATMAGTTIYYEDCGLKLSGDETCVELPEKPILSICDHTWRKKKNCMFRDCFITNLAFVFTPVLH
jgi:hypothetical protein